MKKKQLIVSLKREWKELIRTNRLAIYVVVAAAMMLLCWLTSTTFSFSSDGTTYAYSTNSRYGVIVGTNKLLLSVYLFVALFLTKSLVTRELKEKKLVQPFCMGLKPSVHLSAKYIVQILAPAVVGFLASLINGIIALLVYPEARVLIAKSRVEYVLFDDVLLSAACVFEVIVFCLLLMLSVSALSKKSDLPFVIALLLLILGDDLFEKAGIIFFTPFVFQEYAMKLYIDATQTEAILATVITLAIWTLLTLISIMVYDDRADLA